MTLGNGGLVGHQRGDGASCSGPARDSSRPFLGLSRVLFSSASLGLLGVFELLVHGANLVQWWSGVWRKRCAACGALLSGVATGEPLQLTSRRASGPDADYNPDGVTVARQENQIQSAKPPSTTTAERRTSTGDAIQEHSGWTRVQDSWLTLVACGASPNSSCSVQSVNVPNLSSNCSTSSRHHFHFQPRTITRGSANGMADSPARSSL
ncbi:hypothetical protein VTK56DRAFT_3734 [Thermocarpiscus australiensis]